jgi:predicted metal-binding membrane protein
LKATWERHNFRAAHQPSITKTDIEEEFKMKLKKVLAATLAATMVLASVVTVSATTVQNDGVQESSSAPATYAEQKSLSANATVSVAGTSVKTSLSGVYAAESVQGVAVTTDLATVKANLGLTGNQKPVIIIYDTDTKKSSKAMDSVNAAIAAIGGTYVTALNIDLGAKENGKWVTLSDGSVALATGLPKTADTTKTYSVVCVQPGGVTTILEDQDTNPKTVTFEVQAGLGTYALVAQ